MVTNLRRMLNRPLFITLLLSATAKCFQRRIIFRSRQLSSPTGLSVDNVEAGDDEFLLHHLRNPSLNRSSFLRYLASMVLVTGVSPASSAVPEYMSYPLLQGLSTNELLSQRNQVLDESISGFVAGASLTLTKTLIKYPLDTATVRLQMPNSPYSISNLAALLDGSYRGLWAPLVANIPAGAVFFSVKDACKSSLKGYNLPRWLTTCLAVGTAQFPYWLVRNPSEVVKTRQQARTPGYGNVSAWEAYQQVQEDAALVGTDTTYSKLSGFYAGYWENVLYAFPADVVKFLVYEQLTGGRSNLPSAEGALAGAAATAVAQLATTPLDVVRNRVMAQQTNGDPGENRPGYWQSLQKIGLQEGLAGLFAGASPRVGKALLSGAIQFATYEESKQKLATFLERRAR
jgi:solute carrier family 25 (mitochondrial S-adenosylmethionine transporter), member 26